MCCQNKCEYIKARLRAVQRANAHYYIDAGLTLPYTQQSIKSQGRWRVSSGPEPLGIEGESKRKERGRRKGGWGEQCYRGDWSMANMDWSIKLQMIPITQK